MNYEGNIMTNQRALIAALAVSFALTVAGCGSDDSGSAAKTAAEPAKPAAETPAVEEAVEAVTAAAEDAAETVTDMAEEAVDTAAEAAEQVASAAAPAAASGEACNLAIEAGDGISYTKRSLSVPSSCAQVTVTLTHTGKLPKTAMGHNWVLVATDDLEAVGMGGISAGVDNSYVPQDDPKVIAATGLVGGGESSSVTFDLSKLDAGGSYSYICTFPGHWSVMRGTFTIEG